MEWPAAPEGAKVGAWEVGTAEATEVVRAVVAMAAGMVVGTAEAVTVVARVVARVAKVEVRAGAAREAELL